MCILCLAGILKLVAVVSVFILAVFLAFELLEINMDFNLGNMFGECAGQSVVPVQLILLQDRTSNNGSETRVCT